ncbi:MAG: hypothetical protein ACJA1Z_002961 [Patiriisocius sp.]|jgi:hypothetical protein
MKKEFLFALVFLLQAVVIAQVKELKIEEERRGNRIMLYGLNETLSDVEATVEVEGSGFRQSKRKPRGILVPATSKVHLINLMVNKGETPQYKVKQTVSDSISRRVLRKEATPIRINPKVPIILYVTEKCQTCDTLVAQLERSVYKYEKTNLAENPETKKHVGNAMNRLDTISTPIFNIKGLLNTELLDYKDVEEKLINGN